MNTDRIVMIDGARTPVGSFGGVFKDVPAHELGAAAVREALTRSGVEPREVRELVMGCVGQVGPDGYNARRVALAAGLPDNTPALSVNRQCGSGLQAIWSAAMEMHWNDLDITVAGGDESMTRMPFYDFGTRGGFRLGDRTLVDGLVMMLTDPFNNIHMGVTAERVAEKYGVSRVEQDEFAAESQRRAATAEARAAFAEEIVPFEISGRKPVTISVDEHPRPDTTVETLAALRPAFQAGGTVTAGNASGINDGAAAVVLARENAAAERGRPGLVALEAIATGAMEPELMGYAPVLALQSLFEKTGPVPVRHRRLRGQRGVRGSGGRGDPRRQARPGQGQPLRRRDRPRSSRRSHRRHPVAARGEGHEAPRPRTGRRHDVHRGRAGTGRAIPPRLTPRRPARVRAGRSTPRASRPCGPCR